jgi:hypothetical protein
MCRAINATGQAADDGHSAGGKSTGELFSHHLAVGRRPPRADHRDPRRHQIAEFTFHIQHWWRIFNSLEQGRVAILSLRDNVTAVVRCGP